MFLSVVIAVHDEQDNILPLIDEIYAALAGGPPFEVVIVDDASRDATAARVEACLAEFPTLRLLRHERCGGKSAGLMTGARAARGRWMVMIDGDGQNDPADIPGMLALVRETPSLVLVNGMRVKRRDTLSKRLASRFANNLRRAMLHDDCPDTGSGLKLIRRDLFCDLPPIDCLHRFIPALVKGRGLAYVNAPINDRPRMTGRSKYTNLHRAAVGVFDLFGVMWLLRRQKRGGQVVEVKTP